jgi:hypothetical protein
MRVAFVDQSAFDGASAQSFSRIEAAKPAADNDCLVKKMCFAECYAICCLALVIRRGVSSALGAAPWASD